MCGRLNVTDDPSVRALCEAMDIELGFSPETMEPQIFQRYLGAASKISIVRESGGKRIMQNATWWLLLEPTETGFKPSKYTSINTQTTSRYSPSAGE